MHRSTVGTKEPNNIAAAVRPTAGTKKKGNTKKKMKNERTNGRKKNEERSGRETSRGPQEDPRDANTISIASTSKGLVNPLFRTNRTPTFAEALIAEHRTPGPSLSASSPSPKRFPPSPTLPGYRPQERHTGRHQPPEGEIPCVTSSLKNDGRRPDTDTHTKTTKPPALRCKGHKNLPRGDKGHKGAYGPRRIRQKYPLRQV